jgi:hypothetical protein
MKKMISSQIYYTLETQRWLHDYQNGKIKYDRYLSGHTYEPGIRSISNLLKLLSRKWELPDGEEVIISPDVYKKIENVISEFQTAADGKEMSISKGSEDNKLVDLRIQSVESPDAMDKVFDLLKAKSEVETSLLNLLREKTIKIYGKKKV